MSLTTILKRVTEQVVTLRMNKEGWLAHDDDAARVDLPITDRRRGLKYTTIRMIGRSPTSVLYSAVEGTFSDEVAQHMKPTIVVKEFAVRARETLRQTEERAEREQKLINLIDEIGRQRNNNACGRDMLCPKETFVEESVGSVINVSQFPNALDLQTFLVEKLYPAFSTVKERKRDYQFEVLNIAIFLFEAVHRLNSAGVIHGDIQPRNIIVSWDNDPDSTVPHVNALRLINIDESHSCLILPVHIAALLHAQGLAELSCRYIPGGAHTKSYSPTARYRDPLAASNTLTTAANEGAYLRLWSLMEMYSCAIVTQLLIDPDQNQPLMTPVLRRTERSVGGLISTLRSMTGDLASRSDLQANAHQLQQIANLLLKGTEIRME